jgi:hypothetical protein
LFCTSLKSVLEMREVESNIGLPALISNCNEFLCAQGYPPIPG